MAKVTKVATRPEVDIDELVDKMATIVEKHCQTLTRDQALDFVEDLISRLEDEAESRRIE